LTTDTEYFMALDDDGPPSRSEAANVGMVRTRLDAATSEPSGATSNIQATLPLDPVFVTRSTVVFTAPTVKSSDTRPVCDKALPSATNIGAGVWHMGSMKFRTFWGGAGFLALLIGAAFGVFFCAGGFGGAFFGAGAATGARLTHTLCFGALMLSFT